MLLLDTAQKFFPKLAFIEVFVQTEGRARNHCCRGEAVSITYSECVPIALVFQHAKRMRLLSSVARPAVPYFSILSHKRHDFRENKFLYEGRSESKERLRIQPAQLFHFTRTVILVCSVECK